jgi:DNA-binding transcriptional ArsR family regulator
MNSSKRAGHLATSSSRPLHRTISAASPARLDLIFSALSSPTRREILARLSEGESTVSELAEPFDISLPAISKHLHVLEQAHVISKIKEGRTYRCRLDPISLVQAAQWINFYRGLWERQLDSLTEYLEDKGEGKR